MSPFKKVSFAPLSSKLLTRFLGYRPIEKSANESLTLCQPEERATSPPIFLANQLSRITDVHEFSAGPDDEIRKATCESEYHSETYAYKLTNVFLVNGNLCSYRDFKKITFEKLGFSPSIITHEFDSAALCSSDAGNDYFAHIIFDDASTALMGKTFGPVVLANLGVPRTAHTTSYFDAFGINYQDLQSSYFKELWVFQDVALNSHRCQRLLQLRNALRSSSNLNPKPKRIYIKRGVTGTRRQLINEDEVIEALEKLDFLILEPEKLSLEEITPQIQGSPLVIGVEGSHLIHGLFNLADHGTLLCIQPQDRFNAIYRPFTDALQLNWGFIVGEGNRDNFKVSIPELMETIEMCSAKKN